MSVQQISVFLESRPGHLRRVLDAFEEEHVSVRGYSASDTGDYGSVRLEDTPGELARVMGIMADCGINVTYSYSLISTYIALSVKDLARAEELLTGEPVELIGQDDLTRPVATQDR